MARGMNLGSILNGVIGLIFGQSWTGDKEDEADEGTYTNIGQMLSEGAARLSGSRLTSAEREANAFSAEQAQLAFERESQFQERMSNTQYQRGVQDMKAAGINPMLAVSNGGASVPSASSSAPGSVTPSAGNLSGLISALISASVAKKQIKVQEKLADSEIAVNAAREENIEADTAKKGAETRSTNVQTDYFEQVKQMRAEGERLANELSRSQVKQTYKNIDKAEQDIKESIARTKSEEEKQTLMQTQAILNLATAENIEKMRPFLQAELSARTESERASARLAAVNEAYQQGLIDEGMIFAAVRAENAGASEKEIRAAGEAFKNGIRDGSYADASKGAEKVAARLFTSINGAVASVLGKW